MFTGIITDQVAIKKSQPTKNGLTLTFEKPKNWSDLALGESIATDGVCLTVAAIRGDEYDCQLVPETLQRTSFGIQVPEMVNVERSLKVSDRFGGHFVQGHVDGLGTVSKIDKTEGWRMDVAFDSGHANLVIYKGSITINGVALTVAKVDGSTLTVALVPHTLNHTTLNVLKVGDKVNLEFDMMGKYINKIIEGREANASSSKG